MHRATNAVATTAADSDLCKRYEDTRCSPRRRTVLVDTVTAAVEYFNEIFQHRIGRHFSYADFPWNLDGRVRVCIPESQATYSSRKRQPRSYRGWVSTSPTLAPIHGNYRIQYNNETFNNHYYYL